MRQGTASASEGVEPREAEIKLRKRISDWEKSEIVNLHLQGLTRDEIVVKTGVSAGGVSGVIKEFTDCADSSGLNEAAKKYHVFEKVEDLRELGIKIKKNETSVEELIGLSDTLERIRNLTSLEKLEDYIKAGESLGDKSHVEASVRMHAIEERTGRSHDDILSDLESKEASVRALSPEVQRLQSQIKNLKSEREKAQTNLNAEKARLEAELGEHLKQHNLTLERIKHISKIESNLSKYSIDLTKLEKLQPIMDTVEQAGYDPKKIVKQIMEEGSLKTQIEEDTKSLADMEERKVKLNQILSSYENKIRESKALVEKGDALKSMGWSRESLDEAIKLTGEAGSPEEVLSRLKFLKLSAEAKAELEKTKAETAVLKEKNSKLTEEITKTLTTLTEKSFWLVDEKIPAIVAEVSNIAKIQINNLAIKYNNLVEKYSRLQADFNNLDKKYQRHQKSLDAAISWTALLNEPEKLPGDKLYYIFIDTMIPRLETWCRSKENKERFDIALELIEKITAAADMDPDKVAAIAKKLEEKKLRLKIEEIELKLSRKHTDSR